MEKHITNPETGISYTLHGDYYLPDLALPEDNDTRPIGIWGDRHGRFLREHRKVAFSQFLMSGRLHSYLADIDEQARERFEFLVKQMAEREGISEELKAKDGMLWVQRMNNVYSRAREVVNDEIIYA